MHTLTGWMGMAMLVLIGFACILALVMLMLWQVRWIVQSSRQIVSQSEPRGFFVDVPPR
jgi:uncharacterized membrane-anchored protein